MLDDTSRVKTMLKKLYIQVQFGRIKDIRDEKFICDLYENKTYTLSPKQMNWLEDLFDKY